MDAALTLSPWLGAALLAVGLVALARGAGAKTILGTFLPGLPLLGVSGAQNRDVLLVAGLALAALAVIVAMIRPEMSSLAQDSPLDDDSPSEPPGRTESRKPSE